MNDLMVGESNLCEDQKMTPEMYEAGRKAWVNATGLTGGVDGEKQDFERVYEAIRSMQCMRWPEVTKHHENIFRGLLAFYNAALAVEPKREKDDIIHMAMAANSR